MELRKMYKYPDINVIFDDLDKYRDFCREFGYVFNEAHLYNSKINGGQYTPYSQYERWRKGHRITNNWKEDRRAFIAKQ